MNKWIIDKSYGNGCALGFMGDKNFIRKSVNFAVNFGLINPQTEPNALSDKFVFINTSEEELNKALLEEGEIITRVNNPDSTKEEIELNCKKHIDKQMEIVEYGRINFATGDAVIYQDVAIT